MGSTSDFPDSDKHLISRLDDMLVRAERRGSPGFLGFLDEREASVLRGRARYAADGVAVRFFGGYEGAERTVLGVFPPGVSPSGEAFPVEALAVRYRPQVSVSHRDLLGAVLGCGIRRQAVGDILAAEGFSVVFMMREIAPFLSEQLVKVGSEGVAVSRRYEGDLPFERRFDELSGTVASPRLDAVLGVLLGSSREQALRRIRAGTVSVDHAVRLTPSEPVGEGAVISVRGIGRFAVDALSEVTRKGRLVLKARKYR